MLHFESLSIRKSLLIAAFLAAAEMPGFAQTPDTTADPAVALLPDVMSPMEKLLWGRKGLMRGVGFPLNEDGREREMRMRRSMLTTHQVGGFLTVAAMTATVVTGQLLINGQGNAEDGYEAHGHEEHDQGLHTAKFALAWSTVGLYSATSLVSLFTPPPASRRKQWSSISWHKSLAVVHFTGMFITPFLGMMIEDNHDVQTFHQVSGYITLAALTGSLLVVTF